MAMSSCIQFYLHNYNIKKVGLINLDSLYSVMACPLISPTTHAIISSKHRAVKFWKSVKYARDFTKFMKMKCKTKNIKGKKNNQ